MKAAAWAVIVVTLFSLLMVPMGGPAAQAEPDPQPERGEASVGQGVLMLPTSLPKAAEPARSGRQVKEYHTYDPQAFAEAKKGGAAAPASERVSGPAPEVSPDYGAGPGAPGLTHEGPMPAAPGATTNFAGMSQAGWIPPDTNIAAGLSNLVEVVNESIAVYSKAGALLSGPFTLQAWFGRPGVSIFDPTVIYRGGRFYLVALLKDNATSTSQIMVSASTTSDATLPWCNYTLNGEQAPTNWADFDRIGATTNRLLIATNQFSWATGLFVQNFLQEITLPLPAGCAPFPVTTWSGFVNSNLSLAFTLAPALDYDAFGGTAFYMTNSRFPGVGSLTVWRKPLAGAWQRFDVVSLAYSTPPDGRQPGTAALIATGDQRMQTAIKRYNRLWIALTTALTPAGCPAPLSALYLGSINAPASTVAAPTMAWQNYYSGLCGDDYYYPAASPDGNGNMLFVFNRSNATVERPNVRFSGWTFAAMPGQTTNGLYGSTRSGPAPGAFTWTCPADPADCRWGDYSGISIDPVNQDDVWIAGEIMIGNDFWGTRIGRVRHNVPGPL